jgi:hypothetical protein
MTYSFKSLEIIGFNEAPAAPWMPRRLTPIFYHEGSAMFSPYEIKDGTLVNPVKTDLREFWNLVKSEEVSNFTVREPFSDGELWMDDYGNIHYTSKKEADKRLAEICDTRMGIAKTALKSGLLDYCIVCARKAYSAEPRIEALALRAAAEYLMMIEDSGPIREWLLGLTEMAAIGRVDLESFRKRYKEIAEIYGRFTN